MVSVLQETVTVTAAVRAEITADISVVTAALQAPRHVKVIRTVNKVRADIHAMAISRDVPALTITVRAETSVQVIFRAVRADLTVVPVNLVLAAAREAEQTVALELAEWAADLETR